MLPLHYYLCKPKIMSDSQDYLQSKYKQYCRHTQHPPTCTFISRCPHENVDRFPCNQRQGFAISNNAPFNHKVDSCSHITSPNWTNSEPWRCKGKVPAFQEHITIMERESWDYWHPCQWQHPSPTSISYACGCQIELTSTIWPYNSAKKVWIILEQSCCVLGVSKLKSQMTWQTKLQQLAAIVTMLQRPRNMSLKGIVTTISSTKWHLPSTYFC